MDGSIPTVQKLEPQEWRKARRRAIASLDHICALCGKYIDVSLPIKDPETGKWNSLAVEVDHITPRARGGSLYELSNLQLTHNICNRKKGSKMAEDYDGVPITNPVPLSNAW